MSRLLRFLFIPLLAFPLLLLSTQVPAQNGTKEKKPAQSGTPGLSAYNRLQAKKGFQVEKIYAVPAKTQGSWVSMTVDPQGRLIVSDQYGKLYHVTPPAIGASADTIKVEAIPIDLGEAQGLLWAFDSLYVMVNHGGKYASGLYRVKDSNGDGELDQVQKLRDFHGAGEHGPHAVLLSPDGKSLFVLCGNHTDLTHFDSSRMPKVWGEDSLLPRMWDASGHAVGRMAPGGWIAKTDPDGKKWELYCGGFRNEYDAAFNKDGELFTYDSDMEWDMNTPWYRPTRVCHCVSGVDFAWRGGTAKFPVYYPDTLPPVIDIGPGSPTGVVFGTGAKFPTKYQDALYICDWSYGKLYAVHLHPEGCTYKGEAEEFITGTPLALTDIVVNPKDGAMYFTTGGRKSESSLYRVTYVGPKEAPTPTKQNPAAVEARSERYRLEAYHGKKDAGAIKAAWPYLKNNDRFLRAAARIAIEHQEPKLWQDKALSEKDTQAALEALLALTRTGDKSVQPRLLAALDRLQWSNLDRMQKLALLRVYGLAFIRMGEPDDSTRQREIARFDPHYPANDREMNAELCKMLVYLQAPSAATKTLNLMRKALTQEEQLEYALHLRNLTAGWTMPQRQEYFRWFLKAAGYKGGNSFQGFVRNIKNDAISHLTPQEQKALQPILTAQPKTQDPLLAKPRPFVKEWKLTELEPLLAQGLQGGRNYEHGRQMFAAANCFACHRFGSEGGSAGPDLTGVSGRFSPKDLLESIIDPSKTISDQYEAITVVLDNGQTVTGRIVNLNGPNLIINTDMLNPNGLQHVNRQRIDAMFPSKVSMMPNGLLNTLHQEEILDLMAYLLSRGDRNHPAFRKE